MDLSDFLRVLFVFTCAESVQAQNIDRVDHSLLRKKREVTCHIKYQKITSGHTACLPPSNNVKAKGLKDDDKQVIVDIHNTVRREVSPTATNMMLMSWDDDVANIAQRWAENCEIRHDENYKRYDFGRFSVGQNLAWGSREMGWSQALKLWADEKMDYDYTSNTSPTGKAIGHYTQMVWATSDKVGCGYAVCGTTHYYVCNYGPAGNWYGQQPYEAGSTCADCPGRCNNGLCDCGGIVCLNGGEMDLSTCKCSCTRDLQFYMSPTCGLNCTGIEDPSWCPMYGASGCKIYTSVPQECPVMCRWCPYATYEEPERGTVRYQNNTPPMHCGKSKCLSTMQSEVTFNLATTDASYKDTQEDRHGLYTLY